MSSTNKTEKLGLNSWLGSDVPLRTDFNSDNSIIDSVVGNHLEDNVMHIEQSEREKWNSQVYVMMYFGDGAESKEITLSCDFVPTAGVIFASRMPFFEVVQGTEKLKNYHYLAFCTKFGDSYGVSSNGKTIKLTQDTSSDSLNGQYKCMNEQGRTYIGIFFR